MEQHRQKPRRGRWVIAAAVFVMLYVASSGPLQFSHSASMIVTFDDDGHGHLPDGSSADALAQDMQGQDLRGAQMDFIMVERAAWWPTVYSPLLWMCRHSWGTWLSHYWSVFPVRDSNEAAA